MKPKSALLHTKTIHDHFLSSSVLIGLFRIYARLDLKFLCSPNQNFFIWPSAPNLIKSSPTMHYFTSIWFLKYMPCHIMKVKSIANTHVMLSLSNRITAVLFSLWLVAHFLASSHGPICSSRVTIPNVFSSVTSSYSPARMCDVVMRLNESNTELWNNGKPQNILFQRTERIGRWSCVPSFSCYYASEGMSHPWCCHYLSACFPARLCVSPSI